MMSGIRLDLRRAKRGLVRSPVLSAAAVLCLGLGLGATIAIFTAVHAALLQPLPFPEPERLVTVFRTTPHFQSGPFSPANYLDLRRESSGLEGPAAVTPGSGLLRLGDRSLRVSTYRASENLFAVLGVRALHGRLFRPGDEEPGRPLVAVLAEDFWRAEFGADPAAVGRTIRLDGEDHEVVGVLPREVRVPAGSRLMDSDIWVPLRISPAQATARRNNHLFLLGRLRPDVDVAMVDERLRAVMDGIIERFPVLRGEQLRVVSMQRESRRAIERPLTLLMGAVTLVLLIAIANVASLLLARGVARRGEWAVRSALGAGRGRMLGTALVESGVLTVGGVTVGLGLAWAGLAVIGARVPDNLPQLAEPRIEPAVLAFALALAVGVAVLAGLAPAWQARRVDPQDALRAEGRGGGGRGHQRFLRGLVVAEVALSLVLVLGAALLLRGFRELARRDPGFDPAPLLTVTVDVPSDRYTDRSPVEAFLRPALAAIRAQPGVLQAGAINLVPYRAWGWNFNIRYEGQPGDDPTRLPLTESRVAAPGFFETMDMTLLRGRLLMEEDDGSAGSPTVVVVNRALVDRDFPDENPVGKRFHTSDTTFATIVGVVSDIRNVGPDRPPAAEVYWSWAQASSGASSFPLVVRVSGEPSAFARPLAAAIRSIEPAAAIGDVRSMEAVIAASMGRPRFYLVLLGVFAAVALLLAAAGLYGVMSYAVEQRRREIGIRSALGSTPADTMRLLLRQGGTVIAVGGAVGLLVGGAATRLLTGMLYGVSPLDATTWVSTATVLTAVGILAVLVPAWRAGRTNPMIAIRSD